MSEIPDFLQGDPDPSRPAPTGPTIDIAAHQQQFTEAMQRIAIEKQEWVVENGQRRHGFYYGQTHIADDLEHRLRTVLAVNGVSEPRPPTPQESAAAFVEEQFPNREFSEAEIEFFHNRLNGLVAPPPQEFETEKASLMASLQSAASFDQMMSLSQRVGEASQRQEAHRPVAFKALAEGVRNELGPAVFDSELADAKFCPQWLPEYASDLNVLRSFAAKGRYIRAYDAARKRIR